MCDRDEAIAGSAVCSGFALGRMPLDAECDVKPGASLFAARRKRTLQQKLRQFLWPQTGILRAWRYRMHRLARIRVSSHKLALGFAAGAFASFTPFVGFHFMIAALVAIGLRGNIVASAVGTAVGNPVSFPFIWLGSYNVGALLLGLRTRDSLLPGVQPAGSEEPVHWLGGFAGSMWTTIEPVIIPMLVGGIPLGLACGVICYWLVRKSLEQLHVRRMLRKPSRQAG